MAKFKEYSQLRKLKHIFNGLIWTLIGLYVALIVLLHLSPVQQFLGSEIAGALAQKFGTKVQVGRIDLGFFNRIIIDDVMMYDQQGDSMLYASRASAKIDILPTLHGKISVTSAQLFGLRANLYKQTAQSKPNFQFVLDSLASKDTTQHKPLDLHIGSLIIRHGNVCYNQRDVASVSGLFSPKHIGVQNLSAHIILDHLTDHNIRLNVKKLAFDDESGLQLKSLRFKVIADQQQALLKDFEINLPHSDFSLGDIQASYRMEDGKIVMPSLQFSGAIKQSKVTLADISCFAPILRKFNDAVYLSAKFSGTANSVKCHYLNFRTGSGFINLQAKGKVNQYNGKLKWRANIDNLNITNDGIQFVAHNLGKNVKIPQEVLRLGTIHFVGTLGGIQRDFDSKGTLQTGVGNADLAVSLTHQVLDAHIQTDGIDLGRILDNAQFGKIATNLHAHGTQNNLTAKGIISHFGFNHYDYQNIKLDGSYNNGLIKGLASIADPNIAFHIAGDYSVKNKKYDLDVQLEHLLPSILGIQVADRSYCLDHITLSANNKNKDSYLDVEAPFMNVHARGQYDLLQVYQSIVNQVAEKLPTLPGIRKKAVTTPSDFTLQANINSTEILRRMFGVPLTIDAPVHIKGNVSDYAKDINLLVTLPDFTYSDKSFHGGNIEIATLGDTLQVDASIAQGKPYEVAPTYHVTAKAANNQLSTLLKYNNHSSKLPVQGNVDASTQFFRSEQGQTAAHVVIHPSHIKLGDTQWEVQPSDIIYQKNHLTVDHFAVSHGDQHILVNGKATTNREDSIVADLKDVDVAYILNLVNFHSVDFTGKASGKAIVKSIFQTPDAYAQLSIKDFTFETGELGILHALVNYNKEKEQIDIDAVADEGENQKTLINGYVSPKRNYIDLGIEAHETNMKFMESFCGSFMEDIHARANGKLNLVGDLSNINLVGDIVAHGKMHMKQLNTDYEFDQLHAHAIPDDILIEGDTLYDRDRHAAIVSGGIHHKHLTRLSYDLNLKARNFLAYDTHEFGDNTFYGTIYATGNVGIHGKSGETIIDIDAMPEANSVFVYNVASPDAISDKSFIHWHDVTPDITDSFVKVDDKDDDDLDLSSDMRINFLVNTNENLTLKLLMDPQSGDYIALNGQGIIRANYYNKGSFDMFGNYLVDHGVYKLTIQNVIKKDFEFVKGGTIAFGGNPYDAPLNLQAKYIVNGVPLSDLSIGRSFSSNNIRVDCLMNISGTPKSPKVDFTMDMPTVNSDAKQMIYSVINSQEEMNQQVLYLLGIGRFYAQSKNNQMAEDAAQQSQTSLAMQSFLSGTISQQINTVLSGLVNSHNWNFGANISTGDEGFNNAEYEGILSGRLLNNRLLFNGQFGYRDNANATQSFIGDFDLRYLIFPNGNLSFRMYNQANDRYFTRNSLNTQGLGLVMKKDFNSLWDLFGIKKKKKK